MSDSKEVVTVNSSPTSAQIAIADQSGVEIYRGTTPATVTLDASAGYFDGQKYTITFSKDGYHPTTVQVDSRINGWYVGNIVFGGFIGWLIVDPLTGAMWALELRTGQRHLGRDCRDERDLVASASDRCDRLQSPRTPGAG